MWNKNRQRYKCIKKYMHKEYQGVWCNSSKEFLNSKNLKFAIFANFCICDKIKVCVEYRTKTGQKVEYFPSSDELLAELVPVYEELDGWKGYSFKEAKSYHDLHENVRKFIEFMENKIGVPIKYINTGKDRGMIVIKE